MQVLGERGEMPCLEGFRDAGVGGSGAGGADEAGDVEAGGVGEEEGEDLGTKGAGCAGEDLGWWMN